MSAQPINVQIDPTVKQTAITFQVTEKTVYSWLKEGILESYLIGRTRRVKSKSIARARGESA